MSFNIILTYTNTSRVNAFRRLLVQESMMSQGCVCYISKSKVFFNLRPVSRNSSGVEVNDEGCNLRMLYPI